MFAPRNILSFLLTATWRGWEGALDLVFPESAYERTWRELYDQAPDTFTPPHEVSPGIFGCTPYHDTRIASLIHAVKFRGRRSAIRKAGTMLAHALTRPPLADIIVHVDMATAIPLHKKRQRERGFNQSECILKEALTRSSLVPPIQKVLTRTKHTEPQTSLSRDKRFANIKNAFIATDPALIRGKTILLFDDVTTTGATLAEARQTLLNAGAREVVCVALAH